MSVQAITWALGRASSLATQAVLFSLANHADEWGITYVGQDTVAEECSCRRPTVTTNMTRLEEEGLIARIRRHDGAGRRTSDLVVLAPLHAERGALRDVDKRAASMYPAAVCDLARLGTPRGHRGLRSLGTPHESLGTPHERLGTLGVHEPSVEPSVEPSESPKRTRDAIDEVLRHYQATRPNGNRCKLGPKERRLVSDALKVRSVEECKLAITGLFRSSWHVNGGFTGLKYAMLGGGHSPDPGSTIDRLSALGSNGHGNGNGNGHGRLRDMVFEDGRSWDELTRSEQDGVKQKAVMGMDPTKSDDAVPLVPSGNAMTLTEMLLAESA